MTIYDAIKQKHEKGEWDVPVTCLIMGKGEARINPVYPHLPIKVYLERYKGYMYYTRKGEYFSEFSLPSLALGHFDTQLETAQAIAEQNFDVE